VVKKVVKQHVQRIRAPPKLPTKAEVEARKKKEEDEDATPMNFNESNDMGLGFGGAPAPAKQASGLLDRMIGGPSSAGGAVPIPMLGGGDTDAKSLVDNMMGDM